MTTGGPDGRQRVFSQPVVASLARRDTAEQMAALSLTDQVTDPELKAGLKDALIRSGLPVVSTQARKERQAERQFVTEQEVLQAQPEAKGWRYDVFYCEDSPPGLSQFAESVLSVMPKGVTVRKRLLPRSINLKRGYGVAGYQIRYEPSELPQAEALHAQLNRYETADRTFRLVPVGSRTPNYLSVFLCP